MTRDPYVRARGRVLWLAGAAVLTTSLAACGGSSSKPVSSQEEAEVVTAAPAADGAVESLSWGVPFGEPPSVDPIAGGDSSANLIKSNVCEPLLRLNADYTITPALATDYAYSADNLTLTFSIRQGVMFSDGSPMTVQDVVFSLARNTDPALASTWASSVYGNVASIAAQGNDQVVVTFKAPDSLFVKAMAVTPGLVSQQSYAAKAGKTYGTAAGGLMCTGPYAIKSWQSGSGMTLTANPHYWDEAFRPHAQTVDLKFITESSALVQGLESGSLDGSYDVPPGSIATLAEKGSVYQGPSPQMLQIYPTASMSDVKLRQAVSMLVDRTAIADQIYHGTAEPMYTFVPELLWGEGAGELKKAVDALDKPDGVDVEGAKTLIASMTDPPTELTMAIIAGNEQMRLASTLLQESMKKAGIALEVKTIQPAENVAYFTNPTARAGVDLIMNTGWAAVPDYTFYARRVVVPRGAFNLMGYEDPTVTDLVTKTVGTFEEPARSQSFAQAMAAWTSDVPLIPAVNPREVSFVREGLGGLTTSFAYVYHPSLATIAATG